MMKSKLTSELIQFTERPRWYDIQGKAMILFGGIIALLSMVAPNVYMLGENASWLPFICVIMLLVGILRCIDALAAKTAQGFLFNMQIGLWDMIVALLVIFSTNDEPNNMNLLIVGYLLMQGIQRNLLLSASKIPKSMPYRMTGLISVILGLMIWVDWPTSLWFLSFSLSVDLGFRGWTLMVMAGSIKTIDN